MGTRDPGAGTGGDIPTGNSPTRINPMENGGRATGTRSLVPNKVFGSAVRPRPCRCHRRGRCRCHRRGRVAVAVTAVPLSPSAAPRPPLQGGHGVGLGVSPGREKLGLNIPLWGRGKGRVSEHEEWSSPVKYQIQAGAGALKGKERLRTQTLLCPGRNCGGAHPGGVLVELMKVPSLP